MKEESGYQSFAFLGGCGKEKMVVNMAFAAQVREKGGKGTVRAEKKTWGSGAGKSLGPRARELHLERNPNSLATVENV